MLKCRFYEAIFTVVWRLEKNKHIKNKKNHDNNRRHDNYVTADIFHSDAIIAGQVRAPFKAIPTNNNRGLVIMDDERAGSHLCMYNAFGGNMEHIHNMGIAK